MRRELHGAACLWSWLAGAAIRLLYFVAPGPGMPWGKPIAVRRTCPQ
jgi:hypothetical protein